MNKRNKDNQGAVLYLRVASVDPQDQRDGIAEQRVVCTRQAERLAAVVTDEYVDAGASGNRMNRPGLLGLLRRVAARPVKYVIVRDRTRLARNAADHRAIQRRLRRAGVTFVTVDNGAHSQVTVDELLGGIR
ncbi:MAG: recombinase family protein [Solirubrobacteraceae bacterium]